MGLLAVALGIPMSLAPADLPGSSVLPAAADVAGPFTVSNADIADKALEYENKWGGQACVDAAMSGSGAPGTPSEGDNDDGECRAFVNCIIKMVTGKNIAYGTADYQQAFRDVKAIEVTFDLAIRGDVIQYDNGGHTAIVLDNLGAGNFMVVNSNGKVHHKVTSEPYTPPAAAKVWRFGQPTLRTEHVAGQLLGHQSGYNYYVVNGQRRLVPDAETLACLEARPAKWYATRLTWDQLNSIPELQPALPGCLAPSRVERRTIQAPGGNSYVVTNGVPQWISTIEGYWCAVRSYPLYPVAVSWDEKKSLNANVEGPTFDCLDPARVEGRTIQAPGGNSYVVENGIPRWIATVEAYWCAIGRGFALYPTPVTWAEKTSLNGGAEGPTFDCLSPARVAHRTVQAPNGFAYAVESNGQPRWIPTTEAYWCAINRGYSLHTNAINWAEKESLGAEGATFDCLDPARVKNHVVREYGGTAYLVDGSGWWHWVPTGKVFNCLRQVQLIPQIDASWTAINELRGTTGQNERGWATC